MLMKSEECLITSPAVNQVPEWAKAEGMEMSQSLEDLWKISDSSWHQKKQLGENEHPLMWKFRLLCAYRLYLVADALNPSGNKRAA